MTVEPFILVGGRSTRFGIDKATFEFEGVTLAERAARTVENVFAPAEATFVTAHETDFPDLGGRRVVRDLIPNRGAAGAIHAALSCARSDWIFALACDLPFVTADLIRLMHGHLRDDLDTVVPLQADGRRQPLCSFFNVETCLPVFKAALESGRKHPSFRELLAGSNVKTIEYGAYHQLPDAARLLRNANTPEDLTAA